MKKIIISVTLILAIATISGYKQPGQNEMPAKNSQTHENKNPTTVNKSAEPETKTAREVISEVKTTLGRQRILFLIKDGSVQAVKSPALWWNYQPRQAGC